MTLTVGIDLGTTNSCIAFHDGTRAQVIDTPEGQKIMPSVVLLLEGDDRVVVGRPAVIEGKEHPEFCYRHVKRLFGEPWHDDEDTGWQTAPGEDGMTWLKGPEDKRFKPAQIAEVLISEMLDCAERRLGERPNQAVITHPAGWRDAQKAVLLEAGKLAGLDRVILLHEPTAAAITHSRTMSKIGHIMVYDWGGGTFDASIGQAGRGPVQVEAADGDPYLGGADIDAIIVEKMVERWREKHGSDLGSDDAAMARLREAAETAKIMLSTQPKAVVDVPLIEAFPQRSMKETITRAELEEWCEPLVRRTLEKCESALRKAGLSKANIRDVVLVGGQTRMPLVVRSVEEFFGRKPLTGQNPEEVVAIGAAIQGAVIDKRMADFTLSDRVSHNFGFETVGNVFHKVIRQGDRFPVERTVILTTEEDDQPEMSVHVLQGDEFRADRNARVAAFDIALDPGVRRGDPSIELTFAIDANGMGAVRQGSIFRYRGQGDE